ncbi:MAG: cobyrinate a,c-diamide synthase [Proteobacteria bacterium]|nr:cobyrinate a,c-diamide synthase [Pseudomonadota bacterium]
MAAGFIVAAPGSGSGKTVLTLALLRALVRAGRRVASFKIGPDYIDPAYHAAASGRPCRNLDLWAMRPETFNAIARDAAADAELMIGEGVMGLFDGAIDGSGATADVAARLGLPVILVIDVKGQGASVAAVVRGFRDHRSDITIAGVILNRVGGENHRAILRKACEGLVPVVGMVPRDDRLVLAERHLGLVQAIERPRLDAFLDAAADLVARHVDLDLLAGLARLPELGAPMPPPAPIAPLGQRIAVARDAAFAFVYPAVLDAWRRAGAEILPFSPLADEAPDAGVDAVYLPGGYPELHAARLEAADVFMTGLRDAAARNAAIFGECGGFMVLGEELIDAEGEHHRMAGLLAVATSIGAPRLHLGYRRFTLAHDGPLGRGGDVFRGHEFHYARLVRQRGTPLFHASDAAGRYFGPFGAVVGRVCGSFLHVIDRESA